MADNILDRFKENTEESSCCDCGKKAAEHYGWKSVKCVKDGAMRSIEDIHEEIYRHVAAYLED